MKLYRFGALLAVTGAAAAVAVPAAANDPVPAPTTCAGMAATDPKGDSEPLGEIPTTTSADLTGLFFRTIKVGDKDMLAIDVQVDGLTKAVPAGATEQRWTTYFKIGDASHTARVLIDATGATKFAWTKVQSTPIPGVVTINQTVTTATTGRIVEGPNGIAEVHVPIAEIAAAGKTIKDAYTESRGVIAETPASTPGLLHDRMPDGAVFAKPFTVSACEAEAKPTVTATPDVTATAEPTSSPTPEPTQEPQQQPQQQPPSGTQPAQPNPGAGQPAKPAQPAKGKAKRKRPTCQAKANRIKNKAKRKAALKKCKKAKTKGKR